MAAMMNRPPRAVNIVGISLNRMKANIIAKMKVTSGYFLAKLVPFLEEFAPGRVVRRP